MEKNATIISTITPTVGGSVCLIRISGPDAITLTNKYFPRLNLAEKKGGQHFFGKLLNDEKRVLDEVVLNVFKNPNSFSGEDVVEISCHSNIFIIEDVLNLFLNNGCRMAEAGEFSRRAFLNGKMDLAQAEAIADLIASKSKSGVNNSLNILGGVLSTKINNLKSKLIDIASLLELELDFSEEDLEIIPRDKYLLVIDEALHEVTKLVNSFAKGRDYQKGIEILITGKPNVGKSSLMNAMLQKDRVIVSATPGTTRDLIHEDIILIDTLVRFIDTAGIRLSEDQIEKEGVSRAKALRDSAQLILFIVDVSAKDFDEDQKLLEDLLPKEKEKLILIANKIDKKINSVTEKYLSKLDLESVYISAKQEKNIDGLQEVIHSRIKTSEKSTAEDVVLSNVRHHEILRKVKELLLNNRKSFEAKEGFEFIAADLRLTIAALSEITGEVTTDDILNNIFANFCIGK